MMSSSLSDMAENSLQGIECHNVRDCVVDVHNEDSNTLAGVSSEKTKNIAEHCKQADGLLQSSPAVEESEKMVETEVSIEDSLDRGFSWVIVCASFVNCFVVGTMFIGFSILYVEITEFFGSSKGVAGWIGSLYMASGSVFGEKLRNSFTFAVYYFSIVLLLI